MAFPKGAVVAGLGEAAFGRDSAVRSWKLIAPGLVGSVGWVWEEKAFLVCAAG